MKFSAMACPPNAAAGAAVSAMRTLLHIAREGEAFYWAKAVSDERAEVRALCRQMAEIRAAFTARLSHLAAPAGRGPGEPFDFDAVTRAETQLLRTFGRTAARHDSRALRLALKQYLPQSQACCEQLRLLTRQVAAADPAPQRPNGFLQRFIGIQRSRTE